MVDYPTYLDRHVGMRPDLIQEKKSAKRQQNKQPLTRNEVKREREKALYRKPASNSDSDGSDSDSDSDPGPDSDCCSLSRIPSCLGDGSKWRLKEDQYILFPARIPGYALREKTWGWLLLDKLKPIKWNDSAFKSLQMEEGKKRLISSLIKGHQDGLGSSFDDIVSGKGKGLIFLLHG
jgi:hypothetical protein